MSNTYTKPKIVEVGDKIKVYTEYFPSFVARCKNLKGDWDSEDKCWIFPNDLRKPIENSLKRIYGDCGDGTVEYVDVEVELNSEISHNYQTMAKLGRVLYKRPYRDDSVRTHKTVLLLDGGFTGSGGSAAYPKISDIYDNTVLLIRDVPKTLISSLDKKEYIKSYTINEDNKSEKDEILKAIEEHKAIITKLEQRLEALE